MSPLVILLPRKEYLQNFGTNISKIVRCYCHDQVQSERNIFDFSLCDKEYQVNHKTQPYWVKVVLLVPNVHSLVGPAIVTLKTLIFACYWGSPLVQFSKFKNFLWVCWFLGENLSNFIYPVWKLHNPYYHMDHLDPKWLDYVIYLVLRINPAPPVLFRRLWIHFTAYLLK